MKKLLSVILVFAIILSSCAFAAFGAVETIYDDSRFYTYEDYEIHYRIIEHEGEYKGRILFLHGFLCSTYAWRNMADIMSRSGYECVLADLPNFGYSTRETPEINTVDREKIIISLMNSIDPGGEWIIAGHSMGGGVAVNITEEVGAKALLLYCPAPQSTMPSSVSKIVNNPVMRFMMNTFFKYGTRISPLVRLIVYAATKDLEIGRAHV